VGFSSRTKADIGAGTHRASRRRCLRTANSSGLCWSVSGLTRSPGVQRPRPPDLRPGALRRLEASARRHVKRGGAGPQGRTQTRFARPPSGYRRSAGPPGERSGGLVRQRTRASPMGPRASRTDGHGGVAGAKRQKKEAPSGSGDRLPPASRREGSGGGEGRPPIASAFDSTPTARPRAGLTGGADRGDVSGGRAGLATEDGLREGRRGVGFSRRCASRRDVAPRGGVCGENPTLNDVRAFDVAVEVGGSGGTRWNRPLGGRWPTEPPRDARGGAWRKGVIDTDDSDP